MKRQRAAFFTAFFLAILLLPLRGATAPKIVEEFFPSGEITVQDAPFLHYQGLSDDGDSIQLWYSVPKDVLALADAYNQWGDSNSDHDGFVARFGVEEYHLHLQTDARIDGGEWQYSDAWDEADWPGLIEPHPLAFHCNEGLNNNPDKSHDSMEVSWLIYIEKDKAGFLAPIITPFTTNEGETNYHYDLTNHTLAVRCRLVLEYGNDDDKQLIFSPWSPETSIGLNGVQEERSAPDIAAEPDAAAAPNVPAPPNVAAAPDVVPAPDVAAPPDAATVPDVVSAPPDVVSAPDIPAAPVSSDFLASPWAQSELKEAAALGLIPERLQGADLTAPITRAEFAAVSVKCYEALTDMKAEPYTPNPFSDTTDVEVLKAYNIDVTNGTSPTAFSPEALLNREQAATMLTRLYKKIAIDGWTLETDGNYAGTFRGMYETPAPFADDKNISGWAKDSVYFMKAKGIIDGVGENKFAPRAITDAEVVEGYAQATREQAILIAKRMVQKLG